MKTSHVLTPEQAHAIRQVLMDVRDAMSTLDSDSCDVDDVQEVIDQAIAELEAPQPRAERLGTFLNAIARSLRAEPRVRTVVMELDAVMGEAHVPTTWEH